LSWKVGVHGYEGFGNQVASDYDGIHAYMLSHFTPMFCLPNQWVMIYKAS
jgi:hypothetical protein